MRDILTLVHTLPPCNDYNQALDIKVAAGGEGFHHVALTEVVVFL
jgi:hypothetical protein